MVRGQGFPWVGHAQNGGTDAMSRAPLSNTGVAKPQTSRIDLSPAAPIHHLSFMTFSTLLFTLSPVHTKKHRHKERDVNSPGLSPTACLVYVVAQDPLFLSQTVCGH